MNSLAASKCERVGNVADADAHRRNHLERSCDGEEHPEWRREQEVGDVGGAVAGDDAAHSGVRSRDLDSDHRAQTVAEHPDPFEATPADETDGPASVRREVGKAPSASRAVAATVPAIVKAESVVARGGE